MSTVLVTGASGFLALHVVGQLLEKGYKVIGSVRSQDKANKLGSEFHKKIGSKADNLSFTIVEDIGETGAFDETFKLHPEIEFVLHTASPFTLGYTDFEKSYYIPAVNGTLGILNSIQKYGSKVSKVVVTSSMASIMNFDKLTDSSFIHDETVWNPMTKEAAQNDLFAYCLSKKLAEEAAWNFVKENNVNFTLNTVTPPYIFGPQFFDHDAAAEKLNQSCQVIANALDWNPDEAFVNNIRTGAAVDVRDVAAFHLIPLEKPGVEGHRLFPASGLFTEQDILNIINENFPQLKLAKGKPDDTENPFRYSNEKTVELVGGYNFIPLKKQVVDTVQQILDARAAK
ncbi:unnamed protein product [Cyberlindnera jadinii]|uniref:NAD(P)-binding protein n=1 Tax=Cyberlindnera jadinii (strain ATCC 18201 / CBS 1600 / BCRC 20928 / JCM 3617 / NBRC 0987 / NRRL Y-1542) TaxID=983966 RepID=A0A0H5C7D4_CYBJN|nr:NAD(P)-binding protein [Cyberlindnera jadinii NRRL Y-1542]ODV71143.1 NAD(P)-binding protein [Cyberlindnera jadinii NRRL Y-1542]CEP24190.1 unnamed protein product [Cyberlindnera jadinii]